MEEARTDLDAPGSKAGPGLFRRPRPARRGPRTAVQLPRLWRGSAGKRASMPSADASWTRPTSSCLPCDELGAADAAASSVAALLAVPGRYGKAANVSGRQLEFDHDTVVLASLCSSATRRATAVALAKMPLRAPVAPGRPFPERFLSRTAVFVRRRRRGRRWRARSIPPLAMLPGSAWRRASTSKPARIIRSRDALPPTARETRSNDDLLFWQLANDTIPSRALGMGLPNRRPTAWASSTARYRPGTSWRNSVSS